MMGVMYVVEINIGPSAALAPVESVAALAGKGLKGDRQFCEDGARPGGALTLIEAEALEDELCEPCLHLQQLTRSGIIKDLIHRGGLNADILTDGQISVGDSLSAG